MSHHCLGVAIKDRLFNLLLGETLEVLLDCLEHEEAFFIFMDINVGHAVAQSCILLELDFLPLWSCDHPVMPGVVVNLIPVLLKLGDGQEVGYPITVEPHLK